MRPWSRFSYLAVGLILAACVSQPSPSAVPTPTAAATPASVAPSASAFPTATPEPAFGLDLPTAVSAIEVTVTVEPNVNAEGDLLVTVTSAASEMVDELVLRWSADLNDALVLAPFVPSEERIRDGGDPLVQEWTKWVIGPGEQGEPAGTISLGYGPLLAGATLAIPLHITRSGDGPVAFDLQVLAGNAILTLAGGGPAELRVEVP